MFETEVRAGAMELDASMPGWDERIDLDRLRLNDREQCVLGQVFGEYFHAMAEQFGKSFGDPTATEWATAHGFFINLDYRDPALVTHYESLRLAWVALITARRASRLAESEGAESSSVGVEELELVGV